MMIFFVVPPITDRVNEYHESVVQGHLEVLHEERNPYKVIWGSLCTITTTTTPDGDDKESPYSAMPQCVEARVQLDRDLDREASQLAMLDHLDSCISWAKTIRGKIPDTARYVLQYALTLLILPMVWHVFVYFAPQSQPQRRLQFDGAETARSLARMITDETPRDATSPPPYEMEMQLQRTNKDKTPKTCMDELLKGHDDDDGDDDVCWIERNSVLKHPLKDHEGSLFD